MWEISGVGEEVGRGAGGEEGGRMGGGGRGVEGDRGWDDITCAQNLHEPHKSMIFRGVGCWAGCVYSSKLIERFRFAFRKLLGEIEAEFVRNLKCLVDFEVRT